MLCSSGLFKGCSTKEVEAVVRRCSLKKGILRNFAKFTGKQLCQSLFFNKVVGLRPANFLKKRLWHRCFPVNFARFLRTPSFKEHLCCLLLKKQLIASFIKQIKDVSMKILKIQDVSIFSFMLLN